MAERLVAWLYGHPSGGTALDQVLNAIPAVPGDERVLAAIQAQTERIRGG
jgi:hypothetical protein